MTVATRRRPVRVAGIAVAVAVTALCGVAQADPTPSPSPTSELPISVELRAITPLAPQPDQTLTLRGRLINTGTEPVSGLQPRLMVSTTRIGSRGQFDDIAATPDGPLPPDAYAATSADMTIGTTALPPGGSTPFSLAVAMSDLHLPQSWQVYEMGVDVVGTTTLGVGTVGQLRTFLPWAPVGQPGTGAPTQLAWIWPLVDRPHRVTSTGWTDDQLAAELRPGGRLDVLLSVAAAAETQHAPTPRRTPKGKRHKRPPPPARPTISPVPLTWAIDPMLVQDARAMSAGYTVGAGKDRSSGSGQSAARTWLAELQTAAGHGAVLELPYADPDLVAVIRAGLMTDVPKAYAVGQPVLSRSVSSSPLTYAWPVGGLSDRRTLDTLADGGTTTFLLDDATLPVVSGNQSLTPGAHAKVATRDGSMDAVLIDDRLSSAVDAAAQDPSLRALTTQRVLSELLMIQAERPCCARSVVIAPDRRWAPSAALVRGLVAGSGRVPWIQPITADQVVASPVYSAVQRGSEVDYPAQARVAELPRSFLRSTLPLTHRIDAFAAILPPGDPQARQFDDGRLRLLSSAWRGDPQGADAARARLERAVQRTMQQVSITTQPDSLVTLTGSSGAVPITVSNELNTPVQVAISAVADPHLEVRRGGRVTRTIRPHTQVPVDVRVTALSRGVATLTVSLFTPGPGGKPYGPPVVLRVNSTAYGLEALIITGAATAVLFVGAGVRLGRRARAARRAARAGT
ncbi:MAG TPA: DUF6049 family protein [Mycobacteriales bacterium]|nr:DUF6049 family protein [Mycobacteriales bacterium]